MKTLPIVCAFLVFPVVVACEDKTSSDTADAATEDDDGDSKRKSKSPHGLSTKPPEKRCSPRHELTTDERNELLTEVDEGKTPCARWAAAELYISNEGMLLNAEKIEHKHEPGAMARVDRMFDDLKTTRERWKTFHPADSFPGKIKVVADKGVGGALGLSALTTAVYAGYPNFTIQAEDVSLDLTWLVPDPPGGVLTEIFIESLGEGFQVGVHSSAGDIPERKAVPLTHLDTPKSFKDLEAWLDERCGPSSPDGGENDAADCGRLVMRVGDAPFTETVELLKKVLAVPVVAKTKGRARVSLACPGVPDVPSGDKCPVEARVPEKAGRLPKEVIQRIVRQNFGRMRLCYQTALKTTPGLKGRVVVRFVIGRDGKTQSVTTSGDLPDQSVIACVGRAFEGLTFPPPDGGIVTVSYPIVFSPSD